MAIIQLDKNESFIAQSNGTFTGNTGSETVKVYEGAVVTTDASIERVEFTRSSVEYTYKAVSTGVQVLYNGAVVASVSAGEKLSFGDGSALVTGTFNATSGVTTYSLNGVAVSTTAAGVAFTPSTAAGEASTISNFTAFQLTTGVDFINGSASNDTFTARLANNANTLQSGDVINGGAGTADTLKAYVGASADFAILAETTGVEKLIVQAQTIATDTKDNNLTDKAVQIDAQLMKGINFIQDDNSRADLLIEDVRLDFEANPQAITKDVTIAMVSTDPGNVDFGVYFDQHSLLANSNTAGAVLNIQLMDTRSAVAGKDPLLESPFDGFTFTVAGVAYAVKSTEFDNATTYDQLLLAIQNALTALKVTKPELSGITAAFNGTFQAYDTLTAQFAVGQTITLTNTGSGKFGTGEYTTANGSVPASGGYHTQQTTVDPVTTGNLITSTIILDDVGRGNMGGDLVVGGLSTGITDNCDGVQQFDIKVIRNSDLQTLSSTNNKLQVVNVVNDGTVNGHLKVTGAASANKMYAADVALPGDENWGYHGDSYGLNDVRVFDASKMKGDVTLTAQLSDFVVSKYMTLTDSQTLPAADNINFNYFLGAGNDSLMLNISEQNMAAAGTTTREDFVLSITGGDGNDKIQTSIGTGAGTDADFWYQNSKINANLSIDAGNGNDVVRNYGAGDFKINLGSGDDVLYADNSGVQASIVYNGGRAAWSFNSANFDVNNTQSAPAIPTVSAVNATLTVSFLGFEKTVDIANSYNQLANVSISTLTVNQAIKDAINNDSVLNKLLVAEDGPSATLFVRSLIDGATTIPATSPIVTLGNKALTAAQIAIVPALNLFDGGASNEFANFAPQIVTNYAVDGVQTIGANSVAASDNTITPGTGNDVVVLGTSLQSTDTLVYSGYDNGTDTIVHFTQGAAVVPTNVDYIDFSAYLGTGAKFDLFNAPTGYTLFNAVAAGDSAVVDNQVVIIDNAVTAWNTVGTGEFATFGLEDIGTPAASADQIYMVESTTNNGSYDVYHYKATVSGTSISETLQKVATMDFGFELL